MIKVPSGRMKGFIKAQTFRALRKSPSCMSLSILMLTLFQLKEDSPYLLIFIFNKINNIQHS